MYRIIHFLVLFQNFADIFNILRLKSHSNLKALLVEKEGSEDHLSKMSLIIHFLQQMFDQ